MRNEQTFREITDNNSPHRNWQSRRHQFPPISVPDCVRSQTGLRPFAAAGRSHINSLRPLFNQFKAEECAFAGTGADFADFFPGSFAGKVRIPERPCAALDRARRIDGTLATFGVEECAVAVRKLRQRNATAGDSRMKKSNLADGFAEVLRNFKQFFFTGPHHSWRAGAAISALRTGKLQAVAIPWTGLFWRRLFRTVLCRLDHLRRYFFGHDMILVV
jgi:hypothetical protein